jgi:hypothetical protein
LVANPSFFVASASEGAISGIDFNLANNFWGCSFTFGSSSCGIDLRQGMAHLVDKHIFAAKEPAISGYALAIDNPSGISLPTPNPCQWAYGSISDPTSVFRSEQ